MGSSLYSHELSRPLSSLIISYSMQVVLLSLSWAHVIGAGDESAILDQIATASETVIRTEKPEQKQEKLQDQVLSTIPNTTVHYENSNGFLPMVASSTSKTPDSLDKVDATGNVRTNSLNESNNSSVSVEADEDIDERESDEIENDPAYSTEARMFLNFRHLNTNNRRSFEYQDGQNDFELLKVKDDTPVVANYPHFFEVPSSSETEEEATKSSPRHRSKEKGKKLEGYPENYGTILSRPNEGLAINNNHNINNHYYPAKDNEKASQEKVASNYHQQNAMNNDGHRHSRGNASATSSLSRTNQEMTNPVTISVTNYGSVYDNVAAPSQPTNQNRLSRPVVVAEYSFEQSRPPVPGGDDYMTSRAINSDSSEVPHDTINDRDGRFRSDEDSRDVSDDGEYMEYTERPRRIQKSRRRPSSIDNQKRLPKEHRGSRDYSAEYQNQGKRHHSTRTKPHKQRTRGNSWADDHRHRHQDESYDETKYDSGMSETRSQQNSNFKPGNTWSQISPNLEISHSSGVEIGQVEKPKYIVPVNVNLVPVTNFDHATAIGNSQDFDMSNAVLQNIVSATPGNTVSTPTPMMSTPDGAFGHDTEIRVSTPVPDIIVGQNSYQNSMHAVVPHMNDQNKFPTNLKPQYVSSTVTPVFAVTPSVNHNFQSFPIQNVQGTVTPRTTYINQLQQVPTSHGNIHQLIVPQPTLQTVPTLVQTSVQSPSDLNIQVNHHGMQGQNLVNHGNLQVQSIPTMSTVTSTPQPVPVTKFNLVTAEPQSKKSLYSGSTANFLATASLAVGQNDQRQSSNSNSYYLQNPNTQQIFKQQGGVYQVKNVNIAPKTKTYIQTTHLLPAVLQPLPTMTTITAGTQQVMPERHTVQGTNFVVQSSPDQMQQFVNNNEVSATKNFNLPSMTYQMIDNHGSHSSSNVNTLNTYTGVSGTAENAHLPYVGTRNVEIVNPNIKPSPVDATIINPYETMHYPTAVFTTPIPMFATTSVVTARPMMSTTTDSSNVHSLVNSLTEMGSKNNLVIGDTKTYQSQDRPVFNPINFVPNTDVVKNQNALNSKLHATEPLQQNLNLVPLIPGGHFFKPSFSSHSELQAKPKLNTDLETYADQMFRESLKTIYNSQKWNNDRKPGAHRQNTTDLTDITKLKHELQKLKASLSDSKRNKDHEAHYSETKTQTADFPSKKPDELLAALEHMLKTHPTDSFNGYHGSGRPHRHRRPSDSDKYTFGSNSDYRDTKHVRDYMTHSQSGSHRGKGHYHDKPGKKRPNSGPTRHSGPNHFHGPRSHHRHNLSPKSGGLETSATNSDPVHAHRPQFENFFDSGHSRSEFNKNPFDSFASFSNSQPENTKESKSNKGGKDRGINHPRMHNFFGLLMKNKQLPVGGTPNYFRDEDQLNQFFEDEKQRSQQQFYVDNLRDYLHKYSEGNSYSTLGRSGIDVRRSLIEKGTG
ncbi:PREDICTED: uncharacterized protein LOC107194370 [Dufourea novaeangliae]|uniref:uncharacterized protein LOC107194370 n=1 Tax=Dufourea novaeangliae TaxID=178035 RepID=UPI000766FFAC|nr:PREDICTED: uncharacterized protein LOC107194370 [Dufourea novaeangliae]